MPTMEPSRNLEAFLGKCRRIDLIKVFSEYYEHSVLPSSSLKAAEGSLECYHIAS